MLLQYHTLHFPSSIHRLSIGLSVALSLCMPGTAMAFSLMPSEIAETPFAEWETKRGDSFLVDVGSNMGYLVHEDGGFTSFRVATGQRRYVRYIGRTYKASTPTQAWTALSKEVKGDRTTFGPEGTFLRLFDEDGETAYGIHSHRSIEKFLASDTVERYRSMGCILVSKNVLDNIVATFEMNERRLNVLTVDSMGESVTYETLQQRTIGMQ